MIRFASITAATAAFAFTATAGEPVTFGEIDIDASGLISFEEYIAWRTADDQTTIEEAANEFYSADFDSSGDISPGAEFNFLV